jgi:hypothetical protein
MPEVNEMIGTNLKRASLFMILALAGLAAQARGELPYVFRSSNGKLVLHFLNVRRTAISTHDDLYVMTGGFAAESRTQGLALEGSSGTATVGGESGGESLITLATARGAVKLTKTIRTAAGSRQTIIRSTKADYVAGKKVSTVLLAGPVFILDVDAAKHQVLNAQGQSGNASLIPGTQFARSPLLGADLRGDVRVHLQQAGKGSRTVFATSETLHYDATGGHPTVTLRGNVVLHLQSETLTGGTSSLSRVVLDLNADGEMTGWSAGDSQ